jgi:hypothetical protein
VANAKQVWWDAIAEKYNSSLKNDVWKIAPKPTSKSVIDFMHAVDAIIEKSKAKFVGKGFTMKEGVDLNKTFAPIARGFEIHGQDI